jgi:hypothetical protein
MVTRVMYHRMENETSLLKEEVRLEALAYQVTFKVKILINRMTIIIQEVELA